MIIKLLWPLKYVRQYCFNFANSKEPDFVIGGKNNPYLKRYWIIPRNKFFNIYLHQMLHSDEDRALHDHPWINVSWILRGNYIEHTIEAGGIHKRERRTEGTLIFRRAKQAHRLELCPPVCWSLFITGPVIRDWGFHCKDKGWVIWKDFVNPNDKGSVGRGCGEL